LCGPEPSGTGPALIGEAVAAVISENEMVKQGDAEQVGPLPESAGEDAILLAGGGIAGGVIWEQIQVPAFIRIRG
jgi:hypothetical protein